VASHNVGIIPDRYRPGHWKYRIDDKFSPVSYPTSRAAKSALFEELSKIVYL
jgi:hypothetical protein